MYTSIFHNQTFTIFITRIFLLLLMGCILPFQAFTQSRQSVKQEVNDFRSHHKAEFLKDQRSPFYNKKKEMEHLRFYRPKKKYRVEGTFTRTENAKPFEMPTYSGKLKPFVQYGTITFTLRGKIHQLALYQNLRVIRMPGYKDYLFLPFKDHTNNNSTYGGGRYIDMKTTDIKDGKVVLDFNKCYNPWCAYSDGYNCPVPPVDNHLPVKIKAGEKNYKKH